MQRLQVPHFNNKADYIEWANEQISLGVARQEICHALIPQDNLPDDEFKSRSQAEHELTIVMVERNVKGIELEKAGKVDEAIKLFEQNVADKAETNCAYQSLRIIYTKQDKLQEAIRVCEICIALDYKAISETEKNFLLRQIEKLKSKLQSSTNQKPIPKERKKATQNTPTRELATEENGIPIHWVTSQKLPENGKKALFKSSAGHTITIEQLALEHYTLSGCNGIWSENGYWWAIMTLLFWDVIFAKLPNVYTPQLGAFPGPHQDIPLDLFTPEFYIRRKYLIEKRIHELTQPRLFGLSKLNIAEEIRTSHKHHFGEPCRLLDWEKYQNVESLLLAITSLSSEQIFRIMTRMIENFNENRKGFPDLFLVWNGKPQFTEVKGENEKVAPHQYNWMHFLRTKVGVHVEICRVRNA
jgi:tetratricopeptide (TPR) repeat protein